MPKPLVSVIVPAFNSDKYILENLESIKSQSYENWECIVVNDGSTDSTRAKVEDYIQKDLRFILINTANSGVSAARNTAVKHSNGIYIFPLDSDNYFHQECLSRCVAEFEKNSKVKLVYPEANLVGAESGLWNLPPYDYKTMLKYNMVDNSAMYLREDFERVGGYRTNMTHGLEDWDFFIALLYGSTYNQIIKIQDPLYYYRVSETGRRLTVLKSGKQKEMLDLLIYNNFKIYQQYFPDIFNRVHEYEFDKKILGKLPVRLLVRLLIRISTFKKLVTGRN